VARVTGRYVDKLGRLWVTTAQGAAELGPDVNPALIRDWRRRGLITPTIHRGRAWYLKADLLAAEARTAGRTRPRTQPVDDETPGDPQSHSTPGHRWTLPTVRPAA
jgi:hypothetical protein